MNQHDLDTAADVAEILGYQQRAEIIAAQAAQLATLQDLRDQAQAQALRAQHERTLQDTLFALRRSLPALAMAVQQAPQKAACDIVLAEQTLQLLPPEAFTALEWKETAVALRDELAKITSTLQERHGEPIVRELEELREAARVSAAEESARNLQVRREYQDTVRRRKRQQSNQNVIYFVIGLVVIIGFLLLWLVFTLSTS